MNVTSADDSNQTILVMDGDAGIRDLLTRYLQERGCQSVAVADGRKMDEFLEHVHDRSPCTAGESI